MNSEPRGHQTQDICTCCPVNLEILAESPSWCDPRNGILSHIPTRKIEEGGKTKGSSLSSYFCKHLTKSYIFG